MRLNLKALGLALVAALAMSAVAAGAAQATGNFTAEGNVPAVAKGAQKGDVNFFEGTPGDKVECNTATYQARLEEASNTLTVTPHYANCNWTIVLNGCHFEFKTHGTDGAGNTTGTASVICEKGRAIEVRGPFDICRIDLPGSGDGKNQGLTGVTFTNLENGHVTVDVDIQEQIHYTDTDTAFCPFEGDTTGEDGSFVSSVTMQGFKYGGPNKPHAATFKVSTYDAGDPVGIHVK